MSGTNWPSSTAVSVTSFAAVLSPSTAYRARLQVCHAAWGARLLAHDGLVDGGQKLQRREEHVRELHATDERDEFAELQGAD